MNDDIIDMVSVNGVFTTNPNGEKKAKRPIKTKSKKKTIKSHIKKSRNNVEEFTKGFQEVNDFLDKLLDI